LVAPLRTRVFAGLLVLTLCAYFLTLPSGSGPYGVNAAPQPDPATDTNPTLPMGAPSAPSRSLTGLTMTPLCEDVFTGTLTSTYSITNPAGVVAPGEYHIANLDMTLLSVSETRVDISVTSRLYIDSSAPYPLSDTPLPIAPEYLAPESRIQSDHPEMLARAEQLTAGATLQAQAVDRILAWVRASTTYDSEGHNEDALSVLQTGKAYCAGFANLAVGLLRAAAIPARVRVGCVAHYDGWYAGEAGSRHGWIEVYYPDAGWVASDPEISSNLIDTAHIVGFVTNCQQAGTVIERLSRSGILSDDDERHLYDLCTPFEQPVSHPFYSASVTGWDRHPLRATPASVRLLMPVDPIPMVVSVKIDNLICAPDEWQVSTDTSWLVPIAAAGASGDCVRLLVSAEGLSPGEYQGSFTATAQASAAGESLIRTVPVSLTIDEDIMAVYLPLTERH